jgi:hypothetical protein
LLIFTCLIDKRTTLYHTFISFYSFPLVLASIPELAEWGAYSKHKVYTPKDIRELVILAFCFFLLPNYCHYFITLALNPE